MDPRASWHSTWAKQSSFQAASNSHSTSGCVGTVATADIVLFACCVREAAWVCIRLWILPPKENIKGSRET